MVTQGGRRNMPQVGLVVDQYVVSGRSASCAKIIMAAAGVELVFVLGGDYYIQSGVKADTDRHTSEMREDMYRIGRFAAEMVNADPRVLV